MTPDQKKQKAKAIVLRLQELFGEGPAFFAKEVIRTNRILTGISLKLPGIDAMPTLYLENYPETETIEEIANDMAAEFQRVLKSWSQNGPIQVPELTKEFLLNNIFIQAVSKKKNTAISQKYLCISNLDLLGVVRLFVPTRNRNVLNSSILPQKILSEFDITASDAIETAIKNTPKIFAPEIFDWNRDIQKMQNENWHPEPFSTIKLKNDRIYMVTNSMKLNGSGLIFCPQILAGIGEKLGEDYYVIPSSIHEFQIIPAGLGIPVPALKYGLIQQNHDPKLITQEDILTDSVYRYRKNQHILENA